MVDIIIGWKYYCEVLQPGVYRSLFGCIQQAVLKRVLFFGPFGEGIPNRCGQYLWIQTPPSQSMEPENDGFQVRNLVFQGAIFRFHVQLWEGIYDYLWLVYLP